MIFQGLNKLKRSTIMSSIILIVLGILMVICPEEYVAVMIQSIGSILLIFAVIGILEYLDSNRAVIHYMYLTGWLVLGIVGTVVLIFEIHSLYAIGFLFGAFLILSGLVNIINALVYARRSGRKGWWILIVLGALLAVCGLIVLVNPWWGTVPKLFKVIGVMMMFSSLVSILRLIWIWPIKSE